MGEFIEPSDLAPFATVAEAKAKAMIEDAEATAILTAPCLTDLAADDPKRASVKAILRGAILRWHEAGSGAVQTQSAGPFSQTTQYQARRSMFFPSEIEQLQGLCASGEKGKAYTVDTAPMSGGSLAAGHAPWCNLHFLGTQCTCGVGAVA